MGSETRDERARRLRAIADANPGLAAAVALYRDILPLLEEADLRPSPVRLAAEEARERLERGVPLLRGSLPAFDITATSYLMIRLARRLEEHAVEGAGPVREALEKYRVDLRALFSRFFSGADSRSESAAGVPGARPDLLTTIARDALKPALRVWQRQLAPFLIGGARWDKGYCFVCGAPAALAELQGNDQSKHLRCGLCGADWPYPRIRCARCGNEDHDSLGILYPDPGFEKARVAYCDICGSYIKVIVTFEPTPPEILALEDLATLELDDIARRRGYARAPDPDAFRPSPARAVSESE